ncbi:hypothetical protein BCV71DRAFT_286365 [Rhizopus microsporus]|uniref:Uncharacterized protein n=1 Tax=Rhizopus microsporus TaxID=58291 RepID=A0A1X0S0P2_RHIZD|nr:hypothetical protein BCV71DRAFT_286365 [Rhizopus microsporus]
MSSVNTAKFKAHSTRPTASTKAFLEGIDIRILKYHADWIQRSDTFERYYF